ncbi:hypothetical protein OF83DRAFT_535117 [Amylostereum chailletii]|nr:hypothetical protein OF83DRAFT_535117 [Amylostereum chailletii]
MTSLLPNELLVHIIKDVASSQTDLLRLRSADRKFRHLVTPHAFRVLNVGYTPKSAKGLECLLDSQVVAQYVEEISFEDTDDDTRKLVHEPNSDDEAICSSYSNALSALHRFPNLHSLFFDFFATNLEDEWNTGSASAYQQFQRTVLEALSRSPQPHPSLKTLTIEGILPHIHAVYADPAFTAFIGSLHHLWWLVLVDGDEESIGQRPFQNYWDTISTHVLRPAVSLRSLSLAAGDIKGGMPYINFNSVYCPHLESLSLTNVQFAVDTEAFIVQHKGTLTELELDRCAIDYDYMGVDGIPGRSWADVWDRFARELGELRELDVCFEESELDDSEGDELDGSAGDKLGDSAEDELDYSEGNELDDSEEDDPQKRYIGLNVHYGYVRQKRDLYGEDRDRDGPALKALEELVRARAGCEPGGPHD